MEKLKDFLLGTLGVVGYIIWFILSAVLLYAPLMFLDFSFWIDVIIICAISCLPIAGSITEFVIWVLSFVVVVSEPIDGWSIFYFIAFAFYCFTVLLPTALNIVVNIIAWIASLFVRRW